MGKKNRESRVFRDGVRGEEVERVCLGGVLEGVDTFLSKSSRYLLDFNTRSILSIYSVTG